MNNKRNPESTTESTDNSEIVNAICDDRVFAGIRRVENEGGGFRYEFHAFRVDPNTKEVSVSFEPQDFYSLVKVMKGLIVEMVTDGHLDQCDKVSLARLATHLDEAVMPTGAQPANRAICRAVRRVVDYLLMERASHTTDAPPFEVRRMAEMLDEWLRMTNARRGLNAVN